ncbi:D-2-hydroxyacid dehydrogenase [Horticoccus sp. 23ND18S-11]|uniref:D-2-hydroxyacid dehydrogenase n=1 Tax=Horticoccus sp. 23ND18S-11 TaxID=3391832 RepID=UPI0039C936B2
MKLSFRFALITCALLPALAWAQASLPSRKVVFTSNLRLSESDIREMRQAAPALNLVFPTRENLSQELVDAEAVFGSVTREQFLAAKKLRWMQITSAGVENVLTGIPEIVQSPVTVTNMKIVQGIEIADHAFALLLGLTRRIDIAVKDRESETWRSLQQYGPPLELHGKTAVVVGVGGIGTQIAIRAKAFGMTVIGVDPKDLPYTPFLDRTVWPDRLDAVLPEADVVFISAPHTPQTDNLIKAAQFAKMKAGVLFIAVSRGRIYDNDALVEALKSGKVAGAGLDVTATEPLPKGHPLWKTGRVIITPHIAGRSDGEGARYFELYKDNLIRFAKGEPLRHVVDKEKGY